jgi:PAS domain S-box-containing protein
VLAQPRAPIDALPVAAIGVDREGTIVEWNATAERQFGWARPEVEGRALSDVLTNEHGEPLADVVRGGSLSGAEVRVRTRSGGLVDVALWTSPRRATTERFDGLMVIAADIAERKRLEAERTRRARKEAERAEAQARLRQLTFLADASGDLSSSLDLDATLRRVAAVAVPELADWCTLHLLQPDGVIATVAGASADPSLEGALEELQRRYAPTQHGLSPSSRALRFGRSFLVPEVTHRWLARTAVDEAHLRLLERLSPLTTMGVPLIARGRVIGAMTFVSRTPGRRYDAGSLALAEALARRCALAIDNARLHAQTRDALRARETFLSVASHELGGPLARLKLYTEVLQLARSRQDLDDALLKRALASIQRATNRLAGITQDLIDVARWQGGDISLNATRLDFGKLVREVVRGYQDHVEPPVQLKVGRGRHMVVADAGRLEQVCENLLDNSFKYSPDGGDVYAEVRSEGGGVLLQVRDQGIGIPAGAADLIFEPFERAANAERRSVPGMGLGLYICRSIVERHGGRIWAESPGEQLGTTVSVWLPGARDRA